MSAKEIITRGYKAIMSTGEPVLIEQDEIDAVISSAASGHFIKVRQGIINPSFIVSIVADEKRRIEFLEDTKHHPERRSLGMRSLKDIFAASPLTLSAGPPGERNGRTLPANTKQP